MVGVDPGVPPDPERPPGFGGVPPVKNYLPIVIAVGAVVLLLIVFGWSAKLMQDPGERLQSDMAPKLEEAKRILANYKPQAGSLARALPESPPEMTTPPEGASADAQPNPLQDYASRQSGEIRSLLNQLELPPLGPDANRRIPHAQLRAELLEDEKAIDKALQAVNAALAMSAGNGAVSGRNDPAATRLKAMLLHEKANLLYRQAQSERALADEARHTFRVAFVRWREIDAEIKALQHRLEGGELPQVKTPEPPNLSEPASETAEPEPPGTSPSEEERGSIFGLFKKIATPGSSDEAMPAIEENLPGAFTPEPTAPDPMPVRREISTDPTKLLTIDQRRARLMQRQSGVRQEIQQSASTIASLEDQVADVSRRLEDALERKRIARLRMLTMEEQKLDPLQPNALEQFTREFEEVSARYREAEKQSQLLSDGGLANAQFSTDDEDQFLAAPLEPAEPGSAIERVKGLKTLESDLEAARRIHDAQNALLREIGEQIQALDDEKTRIEQRIVARSKTRDEIRDRAAGHAVRAIQHVIAADQLETGSGNDAALPICTDLGPQAVSAARNAASNTVRETSEFLRTQTIEGPVPRLDFLPNHVQLLAADFAFLHARIQAMRASDYQRHAELLSRVEEMGVAPSAALSPDQSADMVAPSAMQSQAAAEAADSAYTTMQGAANEAITLLDENNLSDLWFVGASKAAITYLLAQNARTQEEAAELREKALQIYLRIPPEVEGANKLRPVIQGLTSAER